MKTTTTKQNKNRFLAPQWAGFPGLAVHSCPISSKCPGRHDLKLVSQLKWVWSSPGAAGGWNSAMAYPGVLGPSENSPMSLAETKAEGYQETAPLVDPPTLPIRTFSFRGLLRNGSFAPRRASHYLFSCARCSLSSMEQELACCSCLL